MKTAITLIVLVLSLICNAQNHVAPEVIVSSGGHAELSAMKVTFSIGEPIIGLAVISNAKLTQGFHQTGISELSINSVEELSVIKIFPNPTSGFLTLDLGNNDYGNLEIVIYDIKGRLVFSQVLRNGQRHEINLSALSNGIYPVTILNELKNIATFKIIKQ